MPRPTRAFGRPGTPVIPTAWESDHARVVLKTMTATITIRPPATAPATANTDLSYTPAAVPDPVYAGLARIQVLQRSTGSAAQILGDEVTNGIVYLVAIDRDAAPISRGYVVEVIACNDPTLTDGRRLVVKQIDRGSLRFERDLYCVDYLEETS